MNNILSIIILLGALQGVFISVILYRSTFNKTANKILSGAIFVVSIALFIAYCFMILDFREYTFLIKASIPLPLIFTPLIYIYTKLNTKEIKRISLSEIKYFIPFLALIAYNIPFYVSSIENKIKYFEQFNFIQNIPIADRIEIVFVNFIVFVFAIFIISLVLKMRKNFENDVSNYEEAIIKLMFFLGWATFLFTLTGFILSVLQMFGVEYPSFLEFLTAIGSSFLIYYIGYYTLLHPEVFRSLKDESSIPELPKQKIKSEPNYDDYLAKITKYMEVDKLYKNPELTIQNFSDELNIPSYLVSKIINTKMDTNFYNFVNNFRIEEVKQELIKNNKDKILHIAFDAGFNTKSSFYNYFKKHTGISPKDYIKKMKSN